MHCNSKATQYVQNIVMQEPVFKKSLLAPCTPNKYGNNQHYQLQAEAVQPHVYMLPRKDGIFWTVKGFLAAWLRSSLVTICNGCMYGLPRVQTSIRQQGFAFYGSTVWNSLLSAPHDNSQSLNIFGWWLKLIYSDSDKLHISVILVIPTNVLRTHWLIRTAKSGGLALCISIAQFRSSPKITRNITISSNDKCESSRQTRWLSSMNCTASSLTSLRTLL